MTELFYSGDGKQPNPGTNNQTSLNGNAGADYQTNPKATDSSASVQEKTKPISEAKRRANRENAKKSTGPKTVRGKGYSSRNAITHGLLSKPVLYSPNGTPINEELHVLRARLQEQYGTGDARTDLLVETILGECWRQQKALDVEAQSFKDPNQFLSIGRMPQLLRYRTASQNAMMRSLELLEQSRLAGAQAAHPKGNEDGEATNPGVEPVPQSPAATANTGESDESFDEPQLESHTTPATTKVEEAA